MVACDYGKLGDTPKSWIKLANFCGNEIKDFAAEIARLALLIAEFQCDVRMIGQSEDRSLVLPLKRTGRIHTGNAHQDNRGQTLLPSREKGSGGARRMRGRCRKAEPFRRRQVAYVAEVGEEFVTEYDRRDSRLRVIYDNGTESDVLLRSLQRALHRDQAGRRITNHLAGPLFGGDVREEDLESGTIYVLRSKSDHPTIAAHRELIHKIGVTGGKVEASIANAAMDATFLLADVEVVATYRLFNINRSRLESLLHRVFAGAQLNTLIEDRFGHPIKPREWFLAPFTVIDRVVEKIRDQSITEFEYDPKTASLQKIDFSTKD